jgi:hypothetical protein
MHSNLLLIKHLNKMIGFALPWIYAHLIGDYLLQNDWMALNKKKNSWICLVHILTYMIPFIFTSINPLGLLLIAVQHYIQDRTYIIAWFCRVTGKFQPEISRFWGHVIVDNVVHILWMATVAYYCA